MPIRRSATRQPPRSPRSTTNSARDFWLRRCGSGKGPAFRACRHRASPDFCARIADELSNDAFPTSELVRVLSAAGWQVSDRYRDTIDRLIKREIDRITMTGHWIDAVSNPDPALATSTTRLQHALAQEAIASGRRLTDLLGLIYDRSLMARVGRVLQGTTAGDAGLALESLDVLLTPDHRAPVIGALKTAFDAKLGDLLRVFVSRTDQADPECGDDFGFAPISGQSAHLLKS